MKRAAWLVMLVAAVSALEKRSYGIGGPEEGPTVQPVPVPPSGSPLRSPAYPSAPSSPGHGWYPTNNNPSSVPIGPPWTPINVPAVPVLPLHTTTYPSPQTAGPLPPTPPGPSLPTNNGPNLSLPPTAESSLTTTGPSHPSPPAFLTPVPLPITTTPPPVTVPAEPSIPIPAVATASVPATAVLCPNAPLPVKRVVPTPAGPLVDPVPVPTEPSVPIPAGPTVQVPAEPITPEVPIPIPQVQPQLPLNPPAIDVDGERPEAEPVAEPIVTSVTCEHRKYGYYADPKDCSIFVICNPVIHQDGTIEIQQYNERCPIKTVFNQARLTCTLPEEAPPCKDAPDWYWVNDQFGVTPNCTTTTKPAT